HRYKAFSAPHKRLAIAARRPGHPESAARWQGDQTLPRAGGLMTQAADDLRVQDGVLCGGLRRPINRARDVKGSIHDDETATRLGMRGGTVAGSVHMDLFGPLLLETWGERWWERGTLSLYFVNA